MRKYIFVKNKIDLYAVEHHAGPATARLPPLLRRCRTAPELRTRRRGTSGHTGPPSPTASACWRAISVHRCSTAARAASVSTAAGAPTTKRSGASSPTSTRPHGTTATADGSVAARIPPSDDSRRRRDLHLECKMCDHITAFCLRATSGGLPQSCTSSCAKTRPF